MDIEETTVDQQMEETATDDALQEVETEEESVDSFMDQQDEPAEQEPKPEPQGTSEPGWIKKRVDKAVQKATADLEAQIEAKYAAKYAPLMEKMLDMEAKELVTKGVVKDLETAKELVRYRQGQPPVTEQPVGDNQPRNDKGQYAPKEDPATTARIEMLRHQADKIKAGGGPDVISEFQNNEEIKKAVISGDMDFYDVAEEMKSRKPVKKTTSPMRSPNGASGSEKSTIANMSKEQFARFDRSLDEGKRYRVN